jgi:hypothetical protein
VLYNPTINDTFFVTRFVTDLHDDIRVPLLLHRPLDVDTTSALALIQEQELEQSRCSRREFKPGHGQPTVRAAQSPAAVTVKWLWPLQWTFHVVEAPQRTL